MSQLCLCYIPRTERHTDYPSANLHIYWKQVCVTLRGVPLQRGGGVLFIREGVEDNKNKPSATRKGVRLSHKQDIIDNYTLTYIKTCDTLL